MTSNSPAPSPSAGKSLVAALLEEQHKLSAVDSFAAWYGDHDRNGHEHSHERHYRSLLPAAPPREGEQLAFEVDLDACSGCKACVVACHNLNGLEDDELWRSVGLLHGGSDVLPVIQHVTTACHHCLEPACLSGCPVAAYEKDLLTGIVRHLDDQCIGCQYCMLMCPYDVPKYSRTKGIVRKCDMCSTRLAAGEAPACVQSCPNQAIRITVVSKERVAEECEANLFLPGAPEPGITLPTTIYKTRRPLPRNLLPADYFAARPQHAHLPLVFMLVFTQMSVGALVIDQALRWLAPADSLALDASSPVHRVAAFLMGLVGLAASVLHLGRPRYAWRAVIGLKHSWLSREIAAFGVFATLAAIYAGLALVLDLQTAAAARLDAALGLFVAVSGLAAVGCSVMIYASTRRAFWNAGLTGLKFLLTCAVLGVPAALLISLLTAALLDRVTVADVMRDFGRTLCIATAIASACKLAIDCSPLVGLRSRRLTPLKRTAMLLSGDLAMPLFHRVFLGALGGIGLPIVLTLRDPASLTDTTSALFVALAAALVLVVSTIGELLERYLFFAAVVAPKMPGAPAA